NRVPEHPEPVHPIGKPISHSTNAGFSCRRGRGESVEDPSPSFIVFRTGRPHWAQVLGDALSVDGDGCITVLAEDSISFRESSASEPRIDVTDFISVFSPSAVDVVD